MHGAPERITQHRTNCVDAGAAACDPYVYPITCLDLFSILADLPLELRLRPQIGHLAYARVICEDPPLATREVF